jgi:hypothetical protein
MDTERNAHGRFVPGWRGGPGRKPGGNHALRAEYLSELSETVPLHQWHEVCRIALRQALEGDARAREWIANYLIGRPLQALEISDPDRGRVPWQTMQLIIMAIREAIPDPEAQHRIAEALQKLTHPAPQRLAPVDSTCSTPRALN